MAEGKGPQWAMATPAVLYMVGTACLMLFALLYGLVSPGGIPLIAVVFMVCGVGTFILGTIELARGDILLGSIDMVFGGLIFFGVGATLITAFLAGLGNVDLRMAAYLAFGIAIVLLLFLPNVGKVSWMVFLFFIVLAAAGIVLGMSLLKGVPFGVGPMNIAAILFLVFGLFAYYAATVFITNTVYRAPKLPIGGPIFK